jgi:hypothetical protein
MRVCSVTINNSSLYKANVFAVIDEAWHREDV